MTNHQSFDISQFFDSNFFLRCDSFFHLHILLLNSFFYFSHCLSVKISLFVFVCVYILFCRIPLFNPKLYGSYSFDQRSNLYRFIFSDAFLELFDLCIIWSQIGDIDSRHITLAFIFSFELWRLHSSVFLIYCQAR